MKKYAVAGLLIMLIYSCQTTEKEKKDENSESALKTSEIGIRDPFVLPHKESEKYYMYAQMDNRLNKNNNFKGVEVYTSRNLQSWTIPEPVLILNDTMWATNKVWAPEVHKYRGKFYLFVTLTSHDTLEMKKPSDHPDWPKLYMRGTQIFVADNPTGPFKAFANEPHTPKDWSALDGTLYVEDGTPYMIFCHEWSQIIDGTMEITELKTDLSDTNGEPKTLFRASSADWIKNYIEGKVTDGPDFHMTPTGKLIMIWSSFGEQGYAIGKAVSESGKIHGPWTQKERLFKENGGHGMIFRTFNNELVISLHQPNSGGKERAIFYKLIEEEDDIKLGEKLFSKQDN